MISSFLRWSFLGLTILVLLVVKWYFTPRIPKGFRFPPPQKPIIENVIDIPKKREWETFGEWANKYGELVYLTLMGTSMLIIDSARMACELFDKRSSIYPDRIDVPILNDVMKFGWALTFHRYDDWWRRHRRVFHDKFSAGAVVLYRPTQLKRARELLKRLLQAPEDYAEHLRQVAGGMIMENVYGINVKPKDDPFMIAADKSFRALGEANILGTFWVDLFPWMKYIPDWIPGAVFKQKSRVWRQHINDMNELPFKVTNKAMLDGNTPPCFVTAQLEELAANPSAPPDQETVIGAIFAGASDTICLLLIIYMICMPISSGFFSYPSNFQCSIEPHSEKAQELIMNSIMD